MDTTHRIVPLYTRRDVDEASNWGLPLQPWRYLILDPFGRECGMLRDRDAAEAAVRSLNAQWSEESRLKGVASAQNYSEEEV